jgi:inosose dehydratase
MNMTITLATGPVSWGVDFADSPRNPPWPTLLDELGDSGLTAMELGPLGYLPEDPATLRCELSQRGIAAAGSFIFDDLHDPSRVEELVEIATRTAKWISGADGQLLVIIDRPGLDRMVTAGRSNAAPRLDRAAWNAMLDTIKRISEVAQTHGLVPTVHPHAGSYIEFQDEIEALLDDTDLALCLDTGHLAYAGLSPKDAISAYGPRIGHLHLKDIDPAVLCRVHGERLSFWDAIAAHIFCPLGSGMVDLETAGAALRGIGYSGVATIEQDRVPGSGEPLEDLERSIAVARAAGVAAA